MISYFYSFNFSLFLFSYKNIHFLWLAATYMYVIGIWWFNVALQQTSKRTHELTDRTSTIPLLETGSERSPKVHCKILEKLIYPSRGYKKQDKGFMIFKKLFNGSLYVSNVSKTNIDISKTGIMVCRKLQSSMRLCTIPATS